MLRLIAALAAFFLLLVSQPAEARRHHHDRQVTQFCQDRYCGATSVRQKAREGRRWRYYKRTAHRKAWRQIAHQRRAAARRSARYRPVLPVRPPVAVDSPVKASGDLVAAAMRYLGTNPTGWASVWCGRFIAMIAPDAALKVKNPNWARDWASLPKAVRRIGAIVVLTRGRKGGHIGVVAGFGKRGPIVISGNHGRRVGIGEYSESRVLAYVRPG